MDSIIVGYICTRSSAALGNGWHVECVGCAENDIAPATAEHIPIYDSSIPPHNYQTCHECGCLIASAIEENSLELHPNPMLIFEPRSADFVLLEHGEEPDPSKLEDIIPAGILPDDIETLPVIRNAFPPTLASIVW